MIPVPVSNPTFDKELLFYKISTKAGDKIAVIVLQSAAEGDRETTFPNHAAY